MSPDLILSARSKDNMSASIKLPKLKNDSMAYNGKGSLPPQPVSVKGQHEFIRDFLDSKKKALAQSELDPSSPWVKTPKIMNRGSAGGGEKDDEIVVVTYGNPTDDEDDFDLATSKFLNVKIDKPMVKRSLDHLKLS